MFEWIGTTKKMKPSVHLQCHAPVQIRLIADPKCIAMKYDIGVVWGNTIFVVVIASLRFIRTMH